MKNISSIAKVVAKVLEVVHWVGAGLMACVAVCSVAAPQWLGRFLDIDSLMSGTENSISVYGFELAAHTPAGGFDTRALIPFAIGAFLIFGLVAMVFRNIYLIIKNSEGASPFQKDNIRMVREIGIFCIAIPVVGLVMSTLAFLFLNTDFVEIKVDLAGLVMGIIVLYLTQVFAYGARLETDVDGLV